MGHMTTVMQGFDVTPSEAQDLVHSRLTPLHAFATSAPCSHLMFPLMQYRMLLVQYYICLLAPVPRSQRISQFILP